MPRRVPDQNAKLARKGIVLLAVLVVVVLLSLSVYHYSDLAFAEYKSADQSLRQAQAQALANSGVHYVAALLSNPDILASKTGGNIYNNPSVFAKVAVQGDAKTGYSGTFTLLAPPDPSDMSGTIRFGVIDESGKINLNAFMQMDSKGQTLLNVLQQLPSMDVTTAGSIVDWLDADDTTQTSGGAESDYYSSLTPPYAARNGNFDTFDELLLVKGVTPDLLFGQFRNPFFGLPTPGAGARAPMNSGNPGGGTSNNATNNNTANNSTAGGGNNSGNSTSGSGAAASVSNTGAVDLGWSAFLTIYSREQNVDPYGNPLVYLNDQDLSNLSQNLTSAGLSASVVNFIILYRQNGSSGSSSSSGSGSGSGSGAGANTGGTTNGASPSSAGGSAGGASGGGSGGTGSGSGNSSQGTVADPAQAQINLAQAGSTTINSVFDLVNAQITVGSGMTAVTYKSPFQDAGEQQQSLPLLWSMSTINKGTDTPARVNVNTAPAEVLNALANMPNLSGGFSSTDVQTILSSRPSLTAPQQQSDPIYNTPVWLLTQAGISASKLSKMDKYITTRSQVYRVQVQGTLDGPNGLSARVEAIIDTNGGQPRILAWRNLGELGKGASAAQLAQAGK